MEHKVKSEPNDTCNVPTNNGVHTFDAKRVKTEPSTSSTNRTASVNRKPPASVANNKKPQPQRNKPSTPPCPYPPYPYYYNNNNVNAPYTGVHGFRNPAYNKYGWTWPYTDEQLKIMRRSRKVVATDPKPKKNNMTAKRPDNTGPPALKAETPTNSNSSAKKKKKHKNTDSSTIKVEPPKKKIKCQEPAFDPYAPYYDDKDEIIIGVHKCYALSIFNMPSYYDVMRTLKESLKTREQTNLKSEHEEVKMSPYEIQMKDIYDEKIFEPMARDDLLKSSLPPNTQPSYPSILESPYALKSYVWEKDVDNPAIRIVDGKIREATTSYLSNPAVCKRVLNKVIGDLNEAVKFKGLTNRWNWYGSYLNGSACKDSTIDFYYEPVPETGNLEKVYRAILKKLKTALEKSNTFFEVESSDDDELFPWIRALYPIIDKKIRIILSSKFHSGDLKVQNSYLTKLYLSMNPDLKDLTVFLKIIMQKYIIHGNGGTGRMNTYTLFWLVVFFMQQKRLLPAVIDVRKAAKTLHHVAEWNCSLPDEFPYPTEPISLYSLLLGFCDFYRDFDFSQYLVCPYLGNVVLLSDCERLLIPSNEFSTYFRLVQNARTLTFCRSVINLQDPTDLSFNIAGRVLDEYANKFKVICHRLSDLLPRFMEQIEKIDCLCNLLPNKMDFDDYFPYTLTQCNTIVLKTRTDLGFDDQRLKKLNQIYVLEAIRKIMEFVFKLEKKQIVIAQNVTQIVLNAKERRTVKRTSPVIYFEYCSSANTWQCDYMKDIVPRNADEKKPITVNLTCDVSLEAEFVKLFVQSDADFIRFLRLYLQKLLKYTLSMIVPA